MKRKKPVKLKCPICGYQDFMKRFRVKTNYPFGKKTKGRTIVRCPKCGAVILKNKIIK